MKNFIILIAAFAVAATTSAQKVSILDIESVDQDSRCGATIEADAGTLTVPAIGQNINPGSICIFTLHLQSRSNFRFNISNLDVSDGERDENCSEAGVRIYSLTNLVPADSVESYTFCNDNPPPSGGSFFLSGNLATVIYHASQNASENSGFTLSFAGIAFQPIPITHESSYSSATSALIRYPVEGEYEPNRVNTWLIKTSDANPNLELDVLLERIDMEECDANGNFSVNDVCLCDALIVYEITSTGILDERSRLCGRSNNTVRIEYLGPNFIVAFFTDYIDVPGQGNGFQVIYKPHEAPTTTTTTTPLPTTLASSTGPISSTTSASSTAPPSSSTTVRPPSSNYTTECGGVLTGIGGLIEYKLNEYYNNDERCVWTIRTPYRSRIRFQLNSAEFEREYDNIQINTFNSTGIQDSHVFYETVTNPISVVLEGTVAIVLFQSDYSNYRLGFSLSFTAEDGFDNSLLYFEDQHTIVNYGNRFSKSFPETGLYRNLELSTITFANRDKRTGWLWLNVTSMDLDVGTDGLCNDKIHVYTIKSSAGDSPQLNHFQRFTPEEGICQTTDVPVVETADAFVVVFTTDAQGRATGIEVEVSVPWLDFH